MLRGNFSNRCFLWQCWKARRAKWRTVFRPSPKWEETSRISSACRTGRLVFIWETSSARDCPAAMYGALVMGMLRGIHKTGEDTATALTILNERLLVRPVAGRYSATLYAVFDPASLQLNFANAGLPYPLRVSVTGLHPAWPGRIALGIAARFQLRTMLRAIVSWGCRAFRHRRLA